MPNSFFRFKKFLVYQDLCAMKVGTDGVLIGAWARGGAHILDVGTGTGVVAMMMSQRFADAEVVAVDIDASSCRQAEVNISASPFAGRVEVICAPIQQLATDEAFAGRFDAVVSNPPFFENALKAPEVSRCHARHTDTLPFSELFASVGRLLSPGGEFSAIIPFDYRVRFETEASLAGFTLSRVCAVRTTPRKPVKRYLLAFRKGGGHELEQTEGLLEVSPGVRSPWYERLTGDFYL